MRTIAAIVLFAAAGVSDGFRANACATRPRKLLRQRYPSRWIMDTPPTPPRRRGRRLPRRRQGGCCRHGCRFQPEPTRQLRINGENVIRAAPPLTPEQQKADEEGRAAWQARCRPTVVEDRDGMRRTKYAEPDCDLSRFNTAGK